MKLAECVNGAVKIAALLQITAGKVQVAQRAIRKVKSPAEGFLFEKEGNKGAKVGLQGLHLPAREMRKCRSKGLRQRGAGSNLQISLYDSPHEPEGVLA